MIKDEVKKKIKRLKKEVLKPAKIQNDIIITSLVKEIESLKEGIRVAMEDK